MPANLRHDQPDFEARFSALLEAKREAGVDVDDAVADIIADVQARGVDAVIELTRRFDRLELTEDTLAFSAAEIDAAIATVPEAERAALMLAAHPRLSRAPTARGRELAGWHRRSPRLALDAG